MFQTQRIDSIKITLITRQISTNTEIQQQCGNSYDYYQQEYQLEELHQKNNIIFYPKLKQTRILNGYGGGGQWGGNGGGGNWGGNNQCPNGCNCQRWKECTSCQSGFYNDNQQSRGRRSQTYSCQQCDQSCQECQGGSKQDCTSCKQNLFLAQDGSCQTCNTAQGYYISDGKCLKCDNNCLTCQAQSTTCISCKSPQILNLSSQCVNCDQNNGYFVSPQNICNPCDASCLTCSGPNKTDCNSCKTNFILSNKQCITCDTTNGNYLNNGQCTKCDPSCKTCNGSNKNNCITCQLNTYLRTDNTCQACDVQNGYYLTSSSICKQCNSSCKKCNGDNSNNCLSCYPNNYLKNDGTCSDCTDSKYFKDQTQMKCLPCDPSCLTCSNSNSNSCLSCPSGKYLYPDNSCQDCQTSNGYYIDTKTNPSIPRCQKCFSTCQACVDAGQSSCTACKPSYLRMNPYSGTNFKCIQCNTSLGQYTTSSGGTQTDCFNCHSSCKTCTDGNNKSCTTCADGLYFVQSGMDKLCQSCQINGQQFVDSNFFCQNCSSQCLKCQGNANTCTDCQDGQYLKKLDNTCGSCGDGFYINGSFCLKCDSSCKTCNGDKQNNCLSCSGSLNLNSINQCVDQCPEGTFALSNVCQACDPSCATCSQAGKCSTCPDGQYIFNDALCQTCPSNYYGDNASKSCKPCDSSCLTCNGPSSSNCLSCPGDITLQSGTCTSQCPSKYIQKNNQCLQCDISCNSCFDVDEYSCISCSNSNYAFLQDKGGKKKCVDCSQQSYYFKQGNDCLPCHPTCLTCNRQNDPNKCLSCPIGKFFQKDDQSCSDCTKRGYYKSSSLCLKCPINCDKCSVQGSNLICDLCSNPYIRDQTLTQCVLCSGDISFYYSPDDKICKKCDSSCKTCIGGKDTDCQSCFNGMNLLISEKRCIVCGDGYFINSPGKCSACIQNCRQCNDQSTCQVCNTSNSQPIYLDENKQCVSSCDQNGGYFIQNDGVLKCLKCDTDCQQCQSKNLCKKCMNNTSLILQTNNVDVKCGVCNQNNYIDPQDQFCKKCDSSCLTCSGPLSTDCLTCDQSQNLYKQPDNSCSTCTGNFKIVGQNCVQCDPKCNGCDSTGCKSCASGFYFVEGSKQCNTCDIQNGKFIQNSLTCISCNSKCKTCSGPSESDCILCNGQLTRDINNQCVVCNVDNGFYIDSINQRCLPCAQNCKKCTGPSIGECTQCAKDLYLSNDNAGNQVCQECNIQNGYFISINKCLKCDSSCKTCNGTSSSECLTCFTGYFIIGSNKSCVQCPTEDQNNIIRGRYSQNCEQYEIVCQQSIRSGNYVLLQKCNKCKQDYILQEDPNACISGCNDIGENLVFNTVTKQCECQSQMYYYNIPNKANQQIQSIFCSQQPIDGYFCNQNKKCYQCNSNCKVCQSRFSCSQCESQYYLWQGQCIQKCEDSQGLIVNSDNSLTPSNLCICKQGYVLREQDKICVLKLQIISLKLTIQNDNNLLTITLNRAPFNDESQDLKLLIDPQTMKLSQDYFIKSMSIIDNKIYYEIQVTQNRKINTIQVTLNKQINTLSLSNTILTTEEFNKSNQSSQQRNQNINDASQILVPDSGSAQKVISIFKDFQILIILSHFLQVLGPIAMFKDNIPQSIYTYSLLGDSFIFEAIPSFQEVNCQISSESTTNQSNNDNQSEQYDSDQLKILTQFGLQKFLYSNFLFPHLSLVLCTVLVFLNLFARAIMKGKQYTMQIVNILLNVMSNLNQGYITPTIFSIYFSLQFSESRGLAVFQAFIHLFFFIEITYILFKKDNEYIENHIPNFLVNINFKAKGMFQEFSVGITFVMISITSKKYTEIMGSTTIKLQHTKQVNLVSFQDTHN
ncbi:transmembrane protein, putative (macronuclear) [Tetrahymena thermophila SB210]|uniref:Transmembrane protein, putative n=1 Tax=Tetrahymena thermophila (strain SB210) TaxID=312017 RepID=Q22M55_TETTS|nr:transmembrane protein, putative [Tetrahymena thermophila SB210]EAR86624.2 transmembrane protein, putative [Tetrahymena thermophila SB210]|eukprot:XP_977165.2 transmembrane protein, putative [Tetrahymena thermophila SB210]